MCGIAGVLERSGGNALPPVATMLESLRHRGPDGFGLYSVQGVQRATRFDDLSFAGESPLAFGHARLAIVGGLHGIQPFEGCRRGLVVLHNGEIYNHKALRARLAGSHDFTTATDSETIVHLLEEEYDGDLAGALAKALPQLDGVFALVVTDGRKVAIARDVLGVRQLYVEEGAGRIAFSSERKALWSVGVRGSGERLLPGHFAVLSAGGAELTRFREPPVSAPAGAPVASGFDEAVRAYSTALRHAVATRVEDMGHLGVLFSGGIDSVLVAKLAKDAGARLTCYAAGTPGSSDLTVARDAARALGLEIRATELVPESVDAQLPRIIQTIESRNLAQVEVAFPVYASVRAAQEDGVRVMLTGQAADELFAGYPWYRTLADEEGYESLRQHLVDDLLRLYKETLEREDKISMAHSIELRVPYLDYGVVRVATGIDPHLTLPPGDRLGKRIHREAAVRLGVPAELAFRPKEAAQHGAGVRGLLEEVARSHGFTPERAERAGRYSARASVLERLGSSQRYGYRYSRETKWETPDHLQMYLDSVAYSLRLTNEEDLALLGSLLPLSEEASG